MHYPLHPQFLLKVFLSTQACRQRVNMERPTMKRALPKSVGFDKPYNDGCVYLHPFATHHT
ncbi:hypothetical protein COCNU_03G001390 [Cocos nucifera]|uniref:Uncharacterized protein n=1 Tax=Cocos nucifera TaxID=13894 RepID=A0A8K0I1B6_COCNU|nr:hypothetical protein COCNU_03G001390 [Cocos nucifera]